MQKDTTIRVDETIIKEYTDTVQYFRKGRGLKMPLILIEVGFSQSTHSGVLRGDPMYFTSNSRAKMQDFIKANAADVSQYHILNGMEDISKASSVSLSDIANNNGNGHASKADVDSMVKKAKEFINPESECGFWNQLQKLIAKKPDNIEIEIRIK